MNIWTIVAISLAAFFYLSIGISMGLIALVEYEEDNKDLKRKEKVLGVLFRTFLWLPFYFATKINENMKYGGAKYAHDQSKPTKR